VFGIECDGTKLEAHHSIPSQGDEMHDGPAISYNPKSVTAPWLASR